MKFRKILSIVVNLLAVIISVVGFIVIRDTLKSIYFIKYFTLITNSLIVIMGLVSIGYGVDSLIKKDKELVLPTPVFALKIITAVCSLITLITVASYLQFTVYKDIGPKNALFWNNIFHHYAATSLFVLGTVLFDLDKKYSFKTVFFGITILIIYMAYAIPLSNLNISWWEGAPYAFMSIKNVGWWMIVILPGFLVAGFGLSVLVWLINRISYLIFIGDEVKQEETSEDEKEVENIVTVTEEDEEKVNEVIKTGYSGPRIYHVSKRREDKMWQVKFASGQKAIKLFSTQAEAIVFAKKLAKSQAGSIRVHSLKGKIRKAH